MGKKNYTLGHMNISIYAQTVSKNPLSNVVAAE